MRRRTARRPSTGSPATRACPRNGISPATHRSSVLLPVPLDPETTAISPGETHTVMSSSTLCEPYAFDKPTVNSADVASIASGRMAGPPPTERPTERDDRSAGQGDRDQPPRRERGRSRTSRHAVADRPRTRLHERQRAHHEGLVLDPAVLDRGEQAERGARRKGLEHRRAHHERLDRAALVV